MPTDPNHARSERLPRWAVAAVLAFAGPLTAAALFACGTGAPSEPAEVPAAVDTAAPPTGLHWQSFQGVDLPVTDQGPHRIDGAVATGYEHSPAGAAVAATQATVRSSIATDTQWPDIGARMLAPGAGRDSWATARAQLSITDPVAEGAPRLLGYVVTRYSPEAVEVEIYSLHPDNSLTRNHAAVAWQYGDWRLALPDPAHDPAPPVTAVAVPPPDLVVFPPR
ncbi:MULTISPECIES: hypothetical protein [Nocardia]|uniref:hypothetical protein n=1 Tax=Nocardia TaxID=1817 RepID=UPI000A878034|nr:MULTISPECIES: hypothetical protein [Nocardia]